MSTEPLLGERTPSANQNCKSRTATSPHYSSIYNNTGSHVETRPAHTINDADITRNCTRSQPTETKVYKRRWYILILFSLLCGTQGCVWNTFGPIFPTTQDAFGWNSGNIGMLTNWGPISLVLSIIPCMWMMERKGLRVASLWASFFITLGTLVRIATIVPPAVTITMNIGQALNGLAGPISMAGPPVLSAVWFPPEQRTVATAFTAFMGMFGLSFAFLIGPMLVPDVPKNITAFDPYSNHSDKWRIVEEREAVHLLMYIECGWSCALFLALYIYFPKKPPLPPSVSANIQRQNIIDGVLHIVRLPQFWIIGLSFGLPLGVMSCWSSVLDVMLKPHGIEQTEAGWIGFASICGGCVMSLVIAAIADRIKRYMKWLVLLLFILGTISFTVFGLATQDIFHSSSAVFIVTIVVGSVAMYASVPLFYEMTSEVAYPTGEATANCALVLLNSLFGGIFLVIMLVPNVGTQWMIWALVGSVGICIPLLFALKTHYNRLDLDEDRPSLNVEVTINPPSV